MPHAPTTSRPDGVTAGQAILTGWLLCGVLDIGAACVQSWIQAGRTPGAVLRGVASAIWGSAALKAGAGMAAIGLAMHFTVALTATLVFYALWRRFAVLRTAPLWIVGPLYGVVVFSAMNYGTLPAMTWVRSLYLGTPPRWPGNMSWPQVAIHMVFVGTPIVWGVRRARLRRSGFGEASAIRRLLRAIVAGSVVAWLVLGATPVFAQGMYLKEIEKDGRIYVFNIQANAERFEKTGEMGAAITMPGTGPKGETVIGDNEKALQLYFFRHNLQVVVPDPAPPAAAPSPGRISGLVFGDYYYFAGNHLSTFEDQQGMWIRRAYFTYDHTFSPAVTTRLRFEANSNGRLQGGSATAYIKDAYARWTFYGRQQLTMGIQPSLTFEFVETVWGLRHIEKTPLDLYRTDSSRDTGFTVAGPINSSGSLRYAYQFGNESGSNGETDEFKAQRASFRFEKNPGFSIEGFWGHFDRALEADRENAQIFVAYRNPKTRLGFTYTFQRREPNNRVGVNTDLDIYSGFGVLDLPRRKVSFYVRVDRFNDPCTDCTQIDYLPIAGNAPFTFTLAGMEYYVLPGFRIGPNIEYVAYSDPASGPKPKNDAVARFTFFWAW